MPFEFDFDDPNCIWSPVRGKCLKVTGYPLFMWLQVQSGKGSRIEELLRERKGSWRKVRSQAVYLVMHRLMRDKRIMPAEQFCDTLLKLRARYGGSGRGLDRWGLDGYCNPDGIVGPVWMDDNGAFHCVRDWWIAQKREREFAKPKYKKMPEEQVLFLKSLYDLTLYAKEMRWTTNK